MRIHCKEQICDNDEKLISLGGNNFTPPKSLPNPKNRLMKIPNYDNPDIDLEDITARRPKIKPDGWSGVLLPDPRCTLPKSRSENFQTESINFSLLSPC